MRVTRASGPILWTSFARLEAPSEARWRSAARSSRGPAVVCVHPPPDGEVGVDAGGDPSEALADLLDAIGEPPGLVTRALRRRSGPFAVGTVMACWPSVGHDVAITGLSGLELSVALSLRPIPDVAPTRAPTAAP